MIHLENFYYDGFPLCSDDDDKVADGDDANLGYCIFDDCCQYHTTHMKRDVKYPSLFHYVDDHAE